MSIIAILKKVDARTEYRLRIGFNGRVLWRVVIDQHYKEKHGDLSDMLILQLVRQLDGQNYPIQSYVKGFEYLAIEPLFYRENSYRLILCLPQQENYLGVVNAFRVKGKTS